MEKSIWESGVSLPKFPSLTDGEECEVAIVGGGIAGLLLAYRLHSRGVPYILIEKGRICSGTTKNTTAKITAQHGLIYGKLMGNEGQEPARAYLEGNLLACREFEPLCEKFECDYEKKDSFAYSVADRAALEREMRALEQIGFRASLAENLPLPIKTVGAVSFKNQAQMNPLKLLSRLAEGLNIRENTFAKEISDGKILTDKGTLRAKRTVIATHFPIINKHGLYFLKMYQSRSYTLALSGAQDVGGMYIDGGEGGFSFRNYKDMLLLGGGHRTGKPYGGFGVLRDFAAAHYPHATEICAFAAQDCITLDGMPYIGHYSKSKEDLFVATGFNKWGMSGSMLASVLLADELCGIKNDLAPYFSASRSIFKKQLLTNAKEAAVGLLSFGKRCPHLGCALRWNKAEHSWDCSCHGSRFSKDGEILDNPSNKRLKG